MYYDVKDERLYMISTWTNTVKCVEHIHSGMEFIVVTEGILHFYINHTLYEVSAGSAAFIAPYEPHRYDSRDVNICNIIEFPVTMNPLFMEYLRNHRWDCPITELRPEALEHIKILLSPPNVRISRFQNIHAQAILSALSQEFIAGILFRDAYKSGIDDIYLAALSYITEHIDAPLSLTAVAETLNVHPQSLSRKFSQKSSMTFTDFVQFIRTQKACAELNAGKSIADAAYAAGFTSIRSFNRVFRQRTNCTPSEYIKKAVRGELPFETTWSDKLAKP